MRHQSWYLPIAVLLVSTITLAEWVSASEASNSNDPLRHLEFRQIGPAAGGRLSRVTGVEGDPSTYYAATASGGVWKSINGGLKWKPVFDGQAISSIGSVAVAPSDPNVVYVGTGEANIRGNVAEGNGIYRSTDAGENWSHVWRSEGQIGSMAVHPDNPDIAFAAVLGSPFGAGEERGVYRTTDGGGSWTRVLYHDADTGASDVTFNPGNPRILFAGLWQTRRYPWGMTSGGKGSGLYRSRDMGETWDRLEGNGLPEGIWGRVGVRAAPSDPDRVYALIEAEEGGLFRSDDGGSTWKLINASRGLRQRAWYYTTLTIDPTNADVVWFPQVPMLKTIDGGKTIQNVKGGGWDYHDVWIDPMNPRRMIVGSDAGPSLSWDGGETWFRPPLPISQFYHLSVDSQTPYRVLGSLQDYGTVSGPSNSLHGGGIYLSDWHGVGGGEAGHVVADPSDPQIVWAGEYLGYISRFDERTGQAPHVGIFPENGSGHGVGDLRYRFQWTSPILVSPHDPQTVYHAGNFLFRTRDGGLHWEAISPDLTRNDKEKQQWAGGPITGDNTGVEFYCTIFAVAESPVEKGVIWAGSDDGLVHVTRDDGASWQNVTPSGMPEWGTVSGIEASRWEAGTAYVVVDAHRLDDETPYVWKTTDFGESWSSLSAGLDTEVYLHVIREDSRKPGMLYLGTERGVMYSLDDGATWRPLKLNLPTVAVADLAVAGDDLVVGTIGRSAWIFDDLTPLREMSPDIEKASAHLFPSGSAVRWRYASSPSGSSDGAASNPPKGALISYYLAEEPEGEISIEVLDSSGQVIRTLTSTLPERPYGPGDPDWRPDTKVEAELKKEAGVVRAHWDLTHQGADEVMDAKIDIGSPRTGPLALPGDYTLRLKVGEEAFTQPLHVDPDPRSSATMANMEAQLEFQLGIRDQMSEIAGMVATIRSLRDQLESKEDLLEKRSDTVELVELGKGIVEKLDGIEEEIHNPNAEVSYDILGGRHGGAQLYSRYSWLNEGAREHDGPPTQGMLEVAQDLDGELERYEAELNEVVSNDLRLYIEGAQELSIGHVVVLGE